MAHFDNMIWLSDRLLFNQLVFRNHYTKNDETWDLGEECLSLIKTKALMDSYNRYFSQKPDFNPNYIFEIGMFSGGSIALWYELFRPRKIVGIDMGQNGENDYFKRYIAGNGLQNKIRTFWNTNQADTARVKQIGMSELPEGIDMVLDDASHWYEPTKRSFEALFPMLHPGGLYIIEDWNWSHMPSFQQKDSIWRDQIELTRLIFDIVEAVGSSSYISNIQVFNGYVIIEKGTGTMTNPDDFVLEQLISRRSL